MVARAAAVAIGLLGAVVVGRQLLAGSGAASGGGAGGGEPDSGPPGAASAAPSGTESAGVAGSAGVTGSAGSAAAQGEEAPLFRPCGDDRKGASRSGRPCLSPARLWCDDGERVVGCCGPGLVPTGDQGTCVCAPGGTDEPEALKAGCREARPDQEFKDAIQRTIRASFGELRPCYEMALRKSDRARGTVAVYFEIGPDGRVIVAEVQQTSLPDADAQKCMLKAFRALRFAPAQNGHTSVTYPIVFSPGE